MSVPSFSDANLEQLCNVLGETSGGLTGGEIGKYLDMCSIYDPNPSNTKRYRLYDALSLKQQEDKCANNICAFVGRVMSPALYADRHDIFRSRQEGINRVLAFEGLSLTDEGKIKIAKKAKTISEAESAASRLRQKLLDRGVHPDVLKFCRAELVQDNYFHAVLEASKSVAQKIRDKTDLTSDGSKLVDEALGIGGNQLPFLAFNTLQTNSEISEHRGLANMLRGLFGAFRNPTAHEPKITWRVTEQDALDILTFASLLHRRLDDAVKTMG